MSLIFVEPDGAWVLECSHAAAEVLQACIETLLASDDEADRECRPDTPSDGQSEWGCDDVH